MVSSRRSRFLQRLVRHHLPLLVLSASAFAVLYFTRPYPDAISRASFATAYPALLLVAFTLVLGPWKLLRAPRVPVSFDLRRDAGIWAGSMSVLHTVFGQMVHLRGRPWLYYVYEARGHHSFPLRHDLFGGANETGLVATLLVVALLATSNDVALRRMGTPGWKRLQRWNYAAFALAGLHAVLYLSVEKKVVSGWALLTVLCFVMALVFQLWGYTRRRRSVVAG